MKTELVDVSPTRKEIKIELEPRLSGKSLTASATVIQNKRASGFRRGHAPRSVVRTRFKMNSR